MNLKQALEPIAPVVGFSSLIGAPGSVSTEKTVDIDLKTAVKKLAEIKDAQKNCGSDYAYWGYEGQRAYWSAVVDILQAAELVGDNNLPDVPPPDIEGKVVMDACWYIQKYGKDVLEKAEEMRAAAPK